MSYLVSLQVLWWALNFHMEQCPFLMSRNSKHLPICMSVSKLSIYTERALKRSITVFVSYHLVIVPWGYYPNYYYFTSIIFFLITVVSGPAYDTLTNSTGYLLTPTSNMYLVTLSTKASTYGKKLRRVFCLCWD